MIPVYKQVKYKEEKKRKYLCSFESKANCKMYRYNEDLFLKFHSESKDTSVSESKDTTISESIDNFNYESSDDELHKWIWFASLPTITGCPKSKLLSMFSDIHELYGVDISTLKHVGMQNKESINTILSDKTREKAWRIIMQTKTEGITSIHQNNSEYPFLLKTIPDAPYVIYRRGEPLSGRYISIVGSRRATGYGINMAERLSADLSEAGFIVVSGMARGIDTAAHTGALKAGGKTVAVLANSVDIIYPPENRALSDRIIKNGTLLSEYPPGTPPVSYHFPVRNRIISGLSEAVLVIEAGEKSGSLITVECALEQGRDIFAVPGNALSVTSRGCNRIIREGAGLVQEVEDILEALPGTMISCNKSQYQKKKNIMSQLNFSEQMVYNRLSKEPMTTDSLCSQTGMNAPEVQQALLMLELKNIILRDLDGTIHTINFM